MGIEIDFHAFIGIDVTPLARAWVEAQDDEDSWYCDWEPDYLPNEYEVVWDSTESNEDFPVYIAIKRTHLNFGARWLEYSGDVHALEYPLTETDEAVELMRYVAFQLKLLREPKFYSFVEIS